METKNREKLYLIVVGTLVVLYLLDLLVFSPLVNSWHSRSDEIVQLKKKIAEGKRLTGYGSSIHDEWDFMRANALVNNPTVAQRQMFSAFGRWVNTSSVVEGSFHPQIQDLNESNYTIVDCESDVSGSFDNMLAFFKTMNKDTTANKVDSFELTAKDDNGRQLALRLSLNGLILTETDPNDAPPTNSPLQNPTSPPEAMAANFKLISLNNIFDQSRVGPRTTEPRPIRTASPRPETLTSDGTGIDPKMGVAFFEGTGVSSSKVYHLGDSVGDFKVAIINLNTVTVTNASNSFTLAVGQGLRREPNGPWKVTGYIAANPVTESTTITTEDSPSAPPAAPGSMEEILRKRREADQ